MTPFDSELVAVEARLLGIPGLKDICRRAIDKALRDKLVQSSVFSFNEVGPLALKELGRSIEENLKHSLQLSDGTVLDCSIDGVEVDIKQTVRDNSMIPKEAFGRIYLLVKALNVTSAQEPWQFKIGLLRMTTDVLNPGVNRDGKRSLNTTGRAADQVDR